MTENENTSSDAVRHVAIVGGGTAGWMAAAAISKVFKGGELKVTVVEPSSLDTVGVGEATIPEIINFNRALGINEKEFIQFTQGTFKLGIEFVHWSGQGSAYFHPFGRYGAPLGSVPFYHYWQKLRNQGGAKPLGEYSLAIQACQVNAFARPVNLPNSPLQNTEYAYHFDAGLYAKFLKTFAVKNGVAVIDSIVNDVIVDEVSGEIKSLGFESGGELEADFYIDCTGFKGLLIEGALHCGYDDWSHLLPCDRAIAVATPKMEPLPPYTQAIAQKAGWRWRIPLQHRTGNGYVYCSKFISDDEAQSELMAAIDGAPLSSPKVLAFRTGVRRKHWEKNCLALGLASGFLEPLESTSIHLIYEAIANFLGMFPATRIAADSVVQKYNDLQTKKFTNIRDLLIFHYWANGRVGGQPFWSHCKRIELPDRLRKKIELYRDSGCIFKEDNEMFNDVSWVSVFQGQGITTGSYNPIVDAMPDAALRSRMDEVVEVVASAAKAIPTHEHYLARYL